MRTQVVRVRADCVTRAWPGIAGKAWSSGGWCRRRRRA